MYPPNNFANNFPYTLDQTIPYKPSFYDINPNSKQEDPPPSSLYYNFPSPCIHYGEGDVFLQQLDDLILQHQPQIAEVNALEPIKTKMAVSEGLKEECYIKRESVNKQAPRKRSSKKDRHSKIETAQGPRDRRMRLSLQVARDFFHLQDMLGYTKASKTVEWLLIKSKAAIKDLTRCSANIASSPSDCEVVSGIEEWNINSSQARNEKGKHPVSLAPETKKSRGLTRKPVFNPLAKESREKARARARERVREKRKMDESKRPLEIVNREMNPLVSWSPFEKGEESSTQDHNNNPQHEILAEVGELSSSMIFNYDLPNHEIPLEHQFSDFQVFSKPWEEYNNINLRYQR